MGGALLSVVAAPACLARFEVGQVTEGQTETTSETTSDDCPEGEPECTETNTDGDTETATCAEACDPVLEICSEDLCVCRPGLDDCGGICVDRDSDPANCGQCGVVCDAGACEDGDCVENGCDDNDAVDCDGACVNLSEHPLHCGACGAPCAGDELCVESDCLAYTPSDCGSDQDCVGGVCCHLDELDTICLDGDECP